MKALPSIDAGVRALAIAPSDANLMYASRSTSILKSVNGGLIWSKPTFDLETDTIWSIARPAQGEQIVGAKEKAPPKRGKVPSLF